MTPTLHTLANLLTPWRTIRRLKAENGRLKEQAVLRARFNWEAQRLVDLKYEQLATARVALQRFQRYGGFPVVRYDLIVWIQSGMTGPLPPLPEHLARREKAEAGEGL